MKLPNIDIWVPWMFGVLAAGTVVMALGLLAAPATRELVRQWRETFAVIQGAP